MLTHVDQIELRGFIAPYQQDIVTPLLNDCMGALPSWVNELCVCGPLDILSTERQACSIVEPEYARVTIGLGSDFFQVSKREQLSTILHEVCHAHTSPILPASCDTEEARRWLEFATSHLEHTFFRLFWLDVPVTPTQGDPA